MNLRTELAEKPLTCPVLHENDIEKITYGPMQIKTFFSKFGEDIDLDMNNFLSTQPLYILNIQSSPSIDGIAITTRIVYRTITRKQNANT